MPDVISLPQLLDLSLGTPELGAVNFNQLHKLLLEIINRLNLAGHPLSVSSGPDIDAKREAKAATTPGYQKSSYNALSEKIGKIERDLGQMTTAVPDSRDMIAKVKTDTPLTDLWQYMQLSKKVGVNEDGINTAMNLIQQLIKDMAELRDQNKDLRSRLDKINMDDINAQLKQLEELRKQMDSMSKLTDKLNDMDSYKTQLNDLKDRLDALPAADEIVTWPGLDDGLSGVRGEFAAYRPESRTHAVETESRATAITPTTTPTALTPTPTALTPTPTALTPTPTALTRPASGHISRASSRPKSTVSDGPSVDLIDGLEKIGTVDKRHEELKRRVDELEKEMQNKADKDDVSGKLPDDLLDRIENMSAKLTELDDLRAKDAESIKRAQKAMRDLQEELAGLQKLIDFLNAENEAKSKQIEKLVADTYKLDQTKADKEYVDAELDAKADKTQIDGKVNRSLFDSTVGDLQKIIDDLLAKLLAYEDAWKQAHAKVEEDVDGKIDRMELDRLKSYLDRKLKELNSKLKQNSGIFNPFCEDAAGLKKQLLPFNCLSCDKPVVVGTGNPLTQSTPGGLGDAFTANKSSRPYTTFELDQIRQHAKSLLNADYVMDYYSMPRSAGGSHTMTFPHRRVTKQAYRDAFKDPAEDIPPEVFLPVRDEAEIVGADGHVYRGRFDPKNILETSSPMPSQDGRPTTPSRPKSSPSRRPTSSRPGTMARPKTAAPPVRVTTEQPEQSGVSRERPVTSMSMHDEGGMADIGDPPVVTIETVAELDPQSTPPANAQDLQA